MNDVTRILKSIDSGDQKAAEELLPLVYDEMRMRKLARDRLAQEHPGQTLQATALVHEAYIRLVQDQDVAWNGRGHFFGAAAEAMRRILIDLARKRRTQKRGGDLQRVELDSGIADVSRDEKLLALDLALDRLGERDPLKSQLVKLRFFAGLTNREAARALGISTATAERAWKYARAWLQKEIASAEL